MHLNPYGSDAVLLAVDLVTNPPRTAVELDERCRANGVVVVQKGRTAMRGGPTVSPVQGTVVLDDDLRPVAPGSGVIGRVARSGDIPGRALRRHAARARRRGGGRRLDPNSGTREHRRCPARSDRYSGIRPAVWAQRRALPGRAARATLRSH